jgi:putative transposase
MNFTIAVSEIKELFSLIKEEPAKLFEMMELSIQKQVGNYLSKLMDMELTDHLGRKPYQREKETGSVQTSKNYRNGSYSRKFFIKRIGEVETKVPRDRNNEFHTRVLPKAKRFDERLSNDLHAMFLSGISTRALSMLSKRLIGRKVSPSEISSASKEFSLAIEKWRTRDLSSENIKYLYIDGVNFSMRVTDSIEKIPFLVIIGVDTNGYKKILLIQQGDKESASSWRQVFKDLKKRGLNYQNIKLGIMDGLSGLEKVFKEEFYNADVQRCQVHVARNVLSKVPLKHKKEVADDLRSIFYASSKDKAMGFFKEFKVKYEKDFPSAFKSLSNSIESCLSFFEFPEEEWISLRTTNVIERLNKEFKRRTKPMEILAGETSSYNLLSFISYKMELSWASTPVGTVHSNLPFYQIYTK